VFATLIGPYPPSDPDHDLDTIAELQATGIEPISDGLGARAVDPDAQAGTVVDAWRAAVAAASAAASASAASVAVKQSLLGPFSAARRDSGDALERAEAVAAVVVALAEAGCPLVEIEEPDAAAIAGDEVATAAFAASLRRLTDRAADSVHLSLVLTGGNVDALGATTLFDLPFASYAFDLIAGPDNWRLIAAAPRDRGIVCGALDPSATSSDRPETLVWAAHYAASTGGRGRARVGLANASTLEGLPRARARAKLVALVEAARLAALEDPEELAASLDPRAVDSRSAALGAYTPRRRG
jgi:methionine synthase II (cobalamin-independent)